MGSNWLELAVILFFSCCFRSRIGVKLAQILPVVSLLSRCLEVKLAQIGSRYTPSSLLVAFETELMSNWLELSVAPLLLLALALAGCAQLALVVKIRKISGPCCEQSTVDWR